MLVMVSGTKNESDAWRRFPSKAVGREVTSLCDVWCLMLFTRLSHPIHLGGRASLLLVGDLSDYLILMAQMNHMPLTITTTGQKGTQLVSIKLHKACGQDSLGGTLLNLHLFPSLGDETNPGVRLWMIATPCKKVCAEHLWILLWLPRQRVH